MSIFNQFNGGQNPFQGNGDEGPYKPPKKPINMKPSKETMGKIKVGGITIGAILLLTIVFNLCTFTVSEAQHAVVTRFGEATRVIVSGDREEIFSDISQDSRFKNVSVSDRKGIFFKVPFIDEVQYMSRRLITYDTAPREVITLDKKKIILDNSAQWKITNPLLFKVSLGNEVSAGRRIDDLLYSKMNEKVGTTEAHTLIADKEYIEKMLSEIVTEMNADVQHFGINVADVRIKRTDLPEENSQNIFTRMKTEREQKAKEYRSQGMEEAQIIKSEAEKEATILRADAYAKSERIKGEGDAEATKIYNEAFNKDPEFYEFYRTLLAYKNTLSDKTKIVIDANSPFAKFLFGK